MAEVQEVLLNLEANMLDLLRERTGQLSENKNKMQVIEGDKTSFVTEQQRKINQLHNYLENRLRSAINDYERAVEPDSFKIRSNVSRLEEHISTNKQLISEI